jgi:hypothetical protein
MADLKDDIAAYQAMRADLESRALGQWALFYNKELIDVFESFEKAANDAVRKFGRGPYLIRQIGAAPATLPASVLYHPINA